jgi:23S rRNA (cytosine1962-C5)-methyltransferase
MGRVQLSGRGGRRLRGGHPWIYADDLALEEAEPGELVAVEDRSGRTVAWGAYSAASKIRVRCVSRGPAKPDRDFWRGRVARALDLRRRAGLLDPAGAARLSAGDADGLPGLVLDRYAGVGVLQCGTLFAERLAGTLIELVDELWPGGLTAVLDRSDARVRRLEGLEARVELLRGELPQTLEIREDDLAYEVDVRGGHKTGHYLDQRDNRRRAAALAQGRDVLDAFSYDGLFGIRAALAGARSVLALDQSEAAGERLLRNAERNGVQGRVRFERADCMGDLRARAAAGEAYSLVVLDPPAFARNRREAAGAERGYRELNLRALRLIPAGGGDLVSASCSFAMSPEGFVGALARAAADAGREVLLTELTGASPDHPALLTLPESRYLKCAFLRVQ